LALREIETRLSIANCPAACVADPPQVDAACRLGPTPQPCQRQAAWCGVLAIAPSMAAGGGERPMRQTGENLCA